MVSEALKKAAKQNPAQAEPDCCFQKGFYWDDAILYAPRERWESAPAPAFWNGPVAHIIPDLEKSFNDLAKLPPAPTERRGNEAASHPT